MKHFLIFLLYIIVFSHKVSSQTNKLSLEIQDEKIDHLYLKINLLNSALYFEGKQTENNIWSFSYPDSIYEKSLFFSIESVKDSSLIRFNFQPQNNIDNSLFCSSCFFSKNVTLKLKHTDLKFNAIQQLIRNPLTGKREKMIMVRRMFNVINLEQDKELEAAMYSFQNKFSRFERDGTSYADKMSFYQNLAKKYPTSYGLMAILAGDFFKYKTKSDIAKIFNEFSTPIQESYFGSRLAHYILPKFRDITMINVKTNVQESLIMKTNRPSLIVFSASWCKPCHEMIPLVQSIQADLKDKLDITYISIDALETRSNWTQMVKQGTVSFRSMFPIDLVEFNSLFNISVIPLCYIVKADGSFYKIEIRDKKQLDSLYKIVE